MPTWDLAISNVLGDFEPFCRIFVAGLLGFALGFDRTHKNKPAGVRTYTFVAVACALITVVSVGSVDVYSGLHETVRMDPMRLTAQIVTGLGFIGAGLILKTGTRVVGLTSAAMIFFAGGAGIGIGAGFYSIVLFASLLVFAVIPIGSLIESAEARRRVTVGEQQAEIID